MATKEEIEDKFRVGFEHIKKFELLSQQQEVLFAVHIERIQALQYLVTRLEELRAFELAANAPTTIGPETV
jgi:flagellar assembly factor FliW